METFDVSGAHLHTDIPKDKRILMNLREGFVEIMCQVNPFYEQHVRYENGQNVLCILVIRAVYGCIKSALLWYKLSSTMLGGLGFEINPYDRCVSNIFIKGTQCTISWYMDANKLLHKNPEVISDTIYLGFIF